MASHLIPPHCSSTRNKVNERYLQRWSTYLSSHPVHAHPINDNAICWSCSDMRRCGRWVASCKLRDDLGLQSIDLVTQAKATVTIIAPDVDNSGWKTVLVKACSERTHIPGVIKGKAVLLSRGNLYDILAVKLAHID